MRFFRVYYTEDDRSAPLDYSFVGSVGEGEARRHSQMRLEAGDSPVSRRRNERRVAADPYGTRIRNDASQGLPEYKSVLTRTPSNDA